ncbi:AbrB/MazE/SpoVT family DNA-binding domain-containing protein [Oceanobacillus sp. CAU 1775]
MSVKERLTIQKRGQITLPKSFIEKFDLQERDSLELEISDNGDITVVPVVQIPASQKWFWSEEWQKGEREAEEDISRGNVKKFDDVHDLIAELKTDD